MSTPSAILIAYYNNPTMPAETVKVESVGACWVGPDGAAWFCPIFADGTYDTSNISPIDTHNADDEAVTAVHVALGLPIL
jgi:hypothetical protein